MIRLKALLTILIAGIGIYVGSKVAPVYYTHYQFQSEMEQAGMVEANAYRSEAEIRDSIAARARDYGIPLKLEQIRVKRVDNELSISTEYTIHFDFPIYPFDLKFATNTKNRRI